VCELQITNTGTTGVVVDVPLWSRTSDEYLVPVDPMDLLECEACQ